MLRGGTILALACVLPGIGWFLLLPYLLLSGLGAVVMSAWSSRRARHEAPAVPVTEAVQA